ncbi:MAG TPA: branched-chain amino acid ABC transporter permease [Polyangia bacterium]|jgi:ABC-type branched-chain amino acid transport system, permease component|nr:branched-chain amino acid ABC transporter permease [Polyangia bacterium]
MARRRNLPLLVLALAVIAVHGLAAAAGKPQYLTQLTMAGYYSLVIVGLTLLMGYTGQISMGHAGFFAIGGYTSGLLTTYNWHSRGSETFVALLQATGLLVAGKDLYGGDLLVVRPGAACVIALLVTVAIAYLVGKPVLKLKGHYLAMATLGFGTIVYKVVLGSSLLGAADGISDIPAFPLFAGLAVTGKSALRTQNYYLAWGLVLGAMALLTNLIHSRVGRALRAIHGAEDAANAMGVDTARYKLQMFVLSAALAALGGVFLTHYNGGIGPSEASIMKSVRYVAIVAVGGMANLWGALIMGVLLNFLSLRGSFGSYDDAVFGLILLAIMLFAPDGLLRVQLLRRLPGLRRLWGRVP